MSHRPNPGTLTASRQHREATAVLDLILGLPWPAVLVVAVLVLAGEPALLAGMVLPSVSTALALGFLAHAGTLPLPLALGTAAAAVIAGDLLGHRAGRRASIGDPERAALRRPAKRNPARRWLTPARQARVAALVARHGGRAIFLGRWVAGARTLVPRLTGSAGTPLWAFARWSVPAGLAWSTCYVLAGYLAGDAYQQVSAVAGQASLALVALAVAVTAAVAAGRWVGRHSEVPDRPAARILGPLALVLIFGLVAAGLSALVALAVRGSGLPQLDTPAAAAFARWPASPPMQAFLRLTPGSGVIAAAAALALCRPVTSGRHRSGPLAALATGGATLPLVVLAVVLHGAEFVAGRDDLFAIQNALLSTAVALATWALARKRRFRAVRGGIWVLGGVAVLLLAVARLSVGWGTVSSTVAGMLIGLIWAGVFVAAWAVRPPSAPARLGSGGVGSSSGPAKAAAAEHGYLVPSVQQTVVQVGEALNFFPAVAESSRVATASTVQLEHLGTPPDQLAHWARPALVHAD